MQVKRKLCEVSDFMYKVFQTIRFVCHFNAHLVFLSFESKMQVEPKGNGCK